MYKKISKGLFLVVFVDEILPSLISTLIFSTNILLKGINNIIQKIQTEANTAIKYFPVRKSSDESLSFTLSQNKKINGYTQKQTGIKTPSI